jgi:Protein of unknown function VcgC/VcgE (DUF2780)
MNGIKFKSIIALFFGTLGLAGGSAVWAENGLMDKAKDVLPIQADKPATVVPDVPSVSEPSVTGAASGAGSSLVDTLVGKFDVSPAQAEGGAGSIFQYAKQKLGEDSFQGIADVVPGMDGLLAAAPKTDVAGGLAGTMGGDSAAGLLGPASVMNNFQELGLSTDMVGKFVPVVVDYVKGLGGSGVGDMLQGALAGL